MSFCELPDVLQDLVTDFAWKMPAKIIQGNIIDILTIKNFNLPMLFYKLYVFDRRTCRYINNPLVIYEPFWELKEVFNTFHIQELLYNLDFRKRNVKVAGSRHFWLQSFEEHYHNIVQFGMFYKMLLANGTCIWTPTYLRQLQHHSATHSPNYNPIPPRI